MGFKDSNIAQGWLVLVLCLCFGSALAAVHVALSPVIEANKINETWEKVPGLVVGQETADLLAARGTPLEIVTHQVQVERAGRTLSYAVYEARQEGARVGWVLKSSGPGYADAIELLVGVDAGARSVTGLFVLDQSETPGLGAKVTEEAWRRQFVGKPVEGGLSVTKSGAAAPGEIDAITGATISADAVVQIVNTVLSDVAPQLSGLGG